MSPEFDTILSTTHWKFTILCVVCRMPPGRLQKDTIPESDVDEYCFSNHATEIPVEYWYETTNIRPTDIFVAVKCGAKND